MAIYENIIHTIGNTPLIRMRKLGRDLHADILLKLEFRNPLGSVKDRIAETMSMERRTLLVMLGAEIVLTPGPLGMKGAIAKSLELFKNGKDL